MKRLAMLVMIAAAIMLGFGFAPTGWKWGGKNAAHAGWSWDPEIAAVDGDMVTLVAPSGASLTLQAVPAAGPTVGDTATVVEKAIIWKGDDGGAVVQPMGWTWNDGA